MKFRAGCEDCRKRARRYKKHQYPAPPPFDDWRQPHVAKDIIVCLQMLKDECDNRKIIYADDKTLTASSIF